MTETLLPPRPRDGGGLPSRETLPERLTSTPDVLLVAMRAQAVKREESLRRQLRRVQDDIDRIDWERARRLVPGYDTFDPS